MFPTVQCFLTKENFMQQNHNLNMENLNLEYLVNFQKYGDQDGHLFRTFIDNWYGFHEGGQMLTKGGKPRWFNNPEPKVIKSVSSSMHFTSMKAIEVLDGQSDSRLVKDHAIPIAVLRKMISSLDTISSKSIKNFLLENYRLGVITKEEDEVLNGKGLKSSMPENWNETNWKARYEVAGIV
ncbi:MAG: hypothetical protein GY751_00020 [Bacteroidetes bacterium]|nr:hypothetical protein [Bacteroidota bacterium]